MADFELLAPGGHQKLVDEVVDRLDLKADIDGYYAQMTVGSADNLTARGDAVEASFIRRTSGGISDIESGNATIKSIKGNTIRWNQRIDVTADAIAGNMGTKTFDSSTGIWSIACTNASTSAFGFYTIPSATRGVVGGHKSLVRAKVKLSTAADVRFGAASNYTTFAVGTDFTPIATVITPNTTVAASCYTNGGDGLTMQVKEIEVFDLTAMFGAGSEPSTVAEFEALYGDPYYAYDAGSLKPVKLNGIETTGFNQWDGIWESGDIDAITGQNTVNANVWRSTNYIPVFPDTAYYVEGTAVSGQTGYIRARFYDGSKNYIGSTDKSGAALAVNVTFTTPVNARYMRFAPQLSNITNHDICINLSWSGRRNGEYEPYWKAERLIALGTHFPTGLKKAGTVYDELTADEAITRVGSVDLGTLNWTYASTNKTSTDGIYRMRTSAVLNGAKVPSANSTVGDIETVPYGAISASVSYVANEYGISIDTSGYIYVNDPNYTASDSPAAFKTAMSGVILYYELATPVVTPIDPPLNLTYKVDDWGTESVMVPSETVSAAPTFGIVYGMNAVDTIRRLPDLYAGKAETEAALAGKADVDGYYSQMTVGAADNLTGRGDTTTAEFLYRTAGGTADIETGQAVAKSVKGNTLGWNQLVPTSRSTGTAGGITMTATDGVYTVTGTGTLDSGSTRAVLATIQVPANHKVYASIRRVSTGATNNDGISVADGYAHKFNPNWPTQDASIIFECTTGTVRFFTQPCLTTLTMDMTLTPQLFDLTAMFGAGNEPSTVAEFEALFPEPYYEYDAGSLLSVNMEGIETVGFNQYPLAEIPLFRGGNTPEFDKSQCFVALGNNQYRVQIDGVSNATSWRFAFVIYEMDETSTAGSEPNEIFSQISYSIYKQTYGFLGNGNGTPKVFTFTTNRNVYVRLYVATGDTILASRGINPCVHLVWSGRRNGEYEPFWSSQREIAASTYFPDGMRSAGSVYDELTSTEAIQRVGVVDLGTLTWTYIDANDYMRGDVQSLNAKSSSVNLSTTLQYTDAYITSEGNRIRFYGTGYTDAVTFKTAMSGVMLHYELATPTVTPIDPPLNLSYRVDDFGTERVMVPDDERSAPPVLDIAYGLNVVDFVRRAPTEYISAASFRQYLLARDAHDGTTTTMTWDDTDNRYEFAITDTVTEG